MENYKLKFPIEFDGETITEINMDLDGLSVKALENAEQHARHMLNKKENMMMPEMSKKYLACVAAISAKVKIDLIRSLSGADYTRVCTLVQNFLLGGDSDSMEELEYCLLPENSSTANLPETNASMESRTDWTN